MSNNDADLVLHLPLDEIRGGSFPDVSGRGISGFINGNVTLVPDDLFGSCAGFPGGANSLIAVPDGADLRIAGDITLQAWIYLTAPAAGWVRVLGKGAFNVRNYGLWYSDTHWLFQRMSGSQLQDCLIPLSEQPLRLNTWYHMAAVLQGNSASLYIHDSQGRPLLPQPQKAVWNGAPLTSPDPLTIGCAGYHAGHNGRIAGVRVYKRALSQAEIERDIRADCLSLVAFRKSHPMDFRLYDDDEQAVLYISDDPAGHNLNLELRNTSTQAIQLGAGQGAAASEVNHHFALRFRPGTLSDNALKLLVNPLERAKMLQQADQWDLYFPSKQPAANEPASLYLLYKGPAKSFQPDERRALTLRRMSAAPGSGARGTQVELIPRQLTAAGGDATPITGSRMQYVHITNQRGKKNIPLHVGFVGGNTVLSDGVSSNTLRLRITNVSKDGAIALNAKTSDAPSKFIISYDVQMERQTKEWALISSRNANSVGVKADGRDIDDGASQGETPEWPITFDAGGNLAAGGHIQIEITGIISSLPAGHANLYVRYENIPGYWDGQFVCVVEKSLLICAENGVVIRAKDPGAALEIKAEGFTHGGWREAIRFRNEDHGAITHPGGGLLFGLHSDRKFYFADIKDGFQKYVMAIDARAGKVGIGKTDPKEALEVVGTVKATKFTGEGVFVKGMIVMWSGERNAIPSGWALCDGENGTPNLADKFIVAAGRKYNAGDTGGAESVALSVQHLPSHNHAASCGSAGAHEHRVLGSDGGWAFSDTVRRGDPRETDKGDVIIPAAGEHAHPITIAATGNNQAHENRPPYYALAFIVKL